jgi:hypothetical protein
MTLSFMQILNKRPSNGNRRGRFNVDLAAAEKKDWMSQDDTRIFERNMR